MGSSDFTLSYHLSYSNNRAEELAAMKNLLVSFFLVALILFGSSFACCVRSASDSPNNTSTTGASLVPSIIWNQTYSGGNSGSVVLQTEEGGFLLGSATVPFLDNPVELLKVDSEGTLIWSKSYLGSSNFLGNWLIQTQDGAYAIAGQYAGGAWLAKIDEAGDLLWNKTYIGDGFSWATSVIQTNDGGYALTGQTNTAMGQTHISSNDANGFIWLLKTDASGNEMWNKTLGDETVNSLIQTSDGGYALVGGGVSGNEPNYLLIKTDSAGEIQWTQTYGSKDKDFAYAVVQTADGGYALGGWMWLRSNGGGLNLGIVKTDALGNLRWTQYYGAGQGWSMMQTNDGGFAIAGTLLVTADAQGNEQWTLDLEGSYAYSVIQTSDGGYAVAGGNGYTWLAKINLKANTSQTVPSATSPFPSASPSPSPPSTVPSSPPQTLTPSPSIPEVPSWMLLPLLAVVTLTIMFLNKKAMRRRLHEGKMCALCLSFFIFWYFIA
jgi:hypothetical protein